MPYLEGPDVSLYQTSIPLAGAAFAIVKISQAGFTDPKHAQHLAAAKAAGVVVGGYHYLDPEPPAVSQAQLFLDHAQGCEFLAVDVEGRILAQGMAFARNMAKGFIEYVHGHDPRKVLMYSSRGTWPGDCGADGRWVADYSGDPNRPGVSPRLPWTFWQYTDKPVDRSRFAGTLEQLHALAGRADPPPSGDAKKDPMTNLVPLTCHRVVDLPKGAVLQKTPGGDTFTTLSAPVTLGLLGATPTHYHVADGDAGVYVSRQGISTRTADKNVGV